jgi:hypothetical protein
VSWTRSRRSRKTAIPCDYAIPALGSTPDANKINVNYIAPSGNELFLYVGARARLLVRRNKRLVLRQRHGAPKVILCPQTCDKVKSTDQGRIDVVFGCDRISVK